MQCTHTLRVLPAFLCLAQPLAAQGTAGPSYRVLHDGEWFHQEANGRRLAKLARGALVVGGEADGEWMRITIGGWIWSASVGPTPRAGFDLVVSRSPEENLRSSPNGALVARLAEGFLLTKLGDGGADRWVRVQRSGWVRRNALEPVTAGEPPGVAQADAAAGVGKPSPAVEDPAADGGRVRPTRATPLFRAPEGPPAGSIAAETPLRVLGRSGEWTRVQVEGWVETNALETAPPGVLLGVSAAELRAEPERYAGRVLRWNLQYLATQVADDLRPEIPRGTTYLLARGPLPERGFVYVIVSEGRHSLIETLTPLAALQATVRVRSGRARFIGNPVVELLTLEVNP